MFHYCRLYNYFFDQTFNILELVCVIDYHKVSATYQVPRKMNTIEDKHI